MSVCTNTFPQTPLLASGQHRQTVASMSGQDSMQFVSQTSSKRLFQLGSQFQHRNNASC